MSNKSTTIELVGHIVTLGDAAVGKTCVMHRFCDDMYNENMLATIGFTFSFEYSSNLPLLGMEFFQKTVIIDNTEIVLQVWDTSGQERYKAISPSFIKRADVVLLTYSVDKRSSFEHVTSWVEQVKNHTTEDVCMILVGNKVDAEGRCVAFEEGEKLAKELNIEFFETSAKENINIEKVFMTAAKKVKEKLEDPVIPRRKTIKIEVPKEEEKEASKKQAQGGCCSS